MTTSPSDPHVDAAAETNRIARDLGGHADTEGSAGTSHADNPSDWTSLALHHADLVPSEPLTGRLIPARRLASRFVWPTVARSLEATRATVHAVEELNQRLEDAESGRAEALSSAAASAQSAQAAVERAEAAALAATDTSERLQQQVDLIQRQLDATAAELRRQRSQRRPPHIAPQPAPDGEAPDGQAPDGQAPDGQGASTSTPGTSALNSAFYSRFEERFRGSRDEVRDLLREHLPLALDAVGSDGTLLDLGSGRAEWLELLSDSGVDAYGVEMSEEFVSQAKELGLDLRFDEAVHHLTSLEPGSLAAVTAFHLVEHLTLDELVAMLDAALEALRPGGLLLLETPNPLNVTVGAATFWLDPTHLRPLHPGLLTLLVEERGFAQVEVRYLHPERLPERDAISGENAWLLQRAADALVGPQDYAVVARRLSLGRE